jgi:hypothetical protein
MRRLTVLVMVAAVLIALAVIYHAGGPSVADPSRGSARVPLPVTKGLAPEPTVAIPEARQEESAKSSVADVGDRCLRRHLNAAAKHRTTQWTSSLGFDRDRRMGYDSARLFAAAYPSEALGLALSWVHQEPPDAARRRFGFLVLEHLAKSGRQEAEQSLHSIAKGTGDMADLALDALHAADSTGKYRSLYLERCRQGNFVGLNAVADHPDPEIQVALMDIEKSNPGKEFEPHNRRLAAKDSLEKCKLLESPDAGDRLKALIRDPESAMPQWFEWALRAASVRRVPELAETLQARLLAAEKKAEEFRKEFVETSPRVAEQVPLETDLRSGGGDLRYDDVLVAYWKLGGILNDFQKRRLYAYGYLGDPKERLAEVLDSAAD